MIRYTNNNTHNYDTNVIIMLILMRGPVLRSSGVAQPGLPPRVARGLLARPRPKPPWIDHNYSLRMITIIHTNMYIYIYIYAYKYMYIYIHT